MIPRILILGVGNPLMADDGVGATVVDLLQAAGLPGGVRSDAVPDIYALPQTWSGEDQVWIVDAMVRNGPPGTIYSLTHDEVLALPDHEASAHHLTLGGGLRWIRHTFPKMAALSFRLWGVEPGRVSPPEGLTEAVVASARAVSLDILNSLPASRRIACD